MDNKTLRWIQKRSYFSVTAATNWLQIFSRFLTGSLWFLHNYIVLYNHALRKKGPSHEKVSSDSIRYACLRRIILLSAVRFTFVVFRLFGFLHSLADLRNRSGCRRFLRHHEPLLETRLIRFFLLIMKKRSKDFLLCRAPFLFLAVLFTDAPHR